MGGADLQCNEQMEWYMSYVTFHEYDGSNFTCSAVGIVGVTLYISKM